MTTKPEARLRSRITAPPGRGRVIDPATDQRCRPHSAEHKAAIRAGWAAAQWRQAQRAKAAEGLPHDPVPMDAATVAALARVNAKTHRSDTPPVVGGCWACYVTGSEEHR